jgi:hypothetical protein
LGFGSKADRILFPHFRQALPEKDKKQDKIKLIKSYNYLIFNILFTKKKIKKDRERDKQRQVIPLD